MKNKKAWELVYGVKVPEVYQAEHPDHDNEGNPLGTPTYHKTTTFREDAEYAEHAYEFMMNKKRKAQREKELGGWPMDRFCDD